MRNIVSQTVLKKGREAQMEQEINVGDWISFKSSGLQMQGKVVQVESDSYSVKMQGGIFPVGRGEGDDIRKIPPPEGEGK